MNNLLVKLLIIAISLSFFACSDNKTEIKDSLEKSAIEVQSSYPNETPTGRLPSTIRPESYLLHLTVDPDQDTFSGKNEINIISELETSHLYLHGQDLDVSKVYIQTANGNKIDATYEQVHSTGIAKISLESLLPKGKSTIFFDYTAPFNTALEALYKVEDGGNNYAFTQYEATSARLSFPSFDEPAFKTPFKTSLVIKDGHKGFSNTPQIAETDLGNGTRR